MIDLQRGLGHGSWQPVTLDGQPTAQVRCPGCTFVATLGHTHDIDDGGNVSPSVDCPDCDFHDHVRLVGWRPR